jgi:hypothetical protein
MFISFDVETQNLMKNAAKNFNFLIQSFRRAWFNLQRLSCLVGIIGHQTLTKHALAEKKCIRALKHPTFRELNGFHLN